MLRFHTIEILAVTFLLLSLIACTENNQQTTQDGDSDLYEESEQLEMDKDITPDGDTTDGDTTDSDTPDGDTTDSDTTDSDTTDGDIVPDCPGGCLIDGICIPDGSSNPAEICQICNAVQDPKAWSSNDGKDCDDSLFCNGPDQCLGGSCQPGTGDACPDDNVFCNGLESCNEDLNRCEHSGDPCMGNLFCSEEQGQCCMPNIPVTDPECDENGDVTAYDSCGFKLILEDCDDAHGTCNNAVCGCATGYAGAACDCILFVDGEIQTEGNGSTWETAYQTIQHAVDAALGMGACAVWVKGGLRYTENVILYDNVELYGGFAGDETIFDARDPKSYQTVLDAQDVGTVVTYEGYALMDNYAVLDSFLLTDGSQGGMRIEQASPIIRNCEFFSNNAPMGGGLYLDGGSPMVIDCAFISNNAIGGIDGEDGAEIDPVGEPGKPGTSGGSGGGMYVETGSPVLINCLFERNTAGNGGSGGNGGYGDHNSGDGASGGDGGHGGALYIGEGETTLHACQFVDNTSGTGGVGGRGSDGVYIAGAGGSGSHGGNGGGIYSQGGSHILMDCLFERNNCGTGAAGGCGGSGTSMASGGDGGSGGTGGAGGGLFAFSGVAKLVNCRFVDNSTGSGADGGLAGNGGGSYSSGGDGGSGGAGGYGGGVGLYVGEAELINCMFLGNETGAGGNGQDGGKGSFSIGGRGGNGGSGGDGGHGGGLGVLSASTTVINGTFYGNGTTIGGLSGNAGIGEMPGAAGSPSEPGHGGGVFIDDDVQGSMANSILWTNMAAGNGDQLFYSGDVFTVSYCDMQDGYSGENASDILDANPQFVDVRKNNLRLTPDSPCINAADGQSLLDDTFDLDQDGNTDEPWSLDLDNQARWIGTDVDMGAYEFEPGRCGNYVVEEGETCDDGNAQVGDGCSDVCVCEADYGKSPEHAAPSCLQILTACPIATDGLYWIAPCEESIPMQTVCDMTRFGGGWTLVVNISGTSKMHGNNPAAFGDLSDETQTAKFSDEDINVLTTQGKWFYECGPDKKAYINNTEILWTSILSNQSHWFIDNDMDGEADCTANRDGFVFSDHTQCGNDLDHTNYASSSSNGCYHDPYGWNLDGNLWAR